MQLMKRYILKNLSDLFLSIFTPLFAIASVIFLIQLATYTAIIELTLWEMGKLYFFILPEILFYTLPISFFVAVTLSLHKLSNENEIIILFSLGIAPKKILYIFLKPAFLLATLLMFDFFILFPHTRVLSSNFVSYKKSEAKFNLSASEFGHRFGEWLLYLGSKDSNENYYDVFLFNKKEKDELLISAKKAEIINSDGILKLHLLQGQGYSYSKSKFSQINFEEMYINDTLTTDLKTYRKPIDYWLSEEKKADKEQMFTVSFLLSLFPLLTLFVALSIGIVHVRHQKSRVYLYMFISIILFYALSISLQKVLSFYTIPLLIFTYLSATYYIYKKNILNKF